MLLLTSTSDLIQVITGSATSVEVHASWVDNASGTITPGRTNTAAITGATTTTVVASPAASTQRNVKHLSIKNDHATLSNVIEVIHTDGTNVETLWEGTLLAQESVVLDANGLWTSYSPGGSQKTTAFVGPVDVQVFTATGAGTWTKPTSFTPKAVIVVMWGAGGGGGAGASLATATVAKGGGGGGGGAYNTRYFQAADLGATENLSVGAGGTAGVPGAAGAAGGDGGVGGTTTFGTVTMLSAFGGGGGRGGAISSAVTGGGR